MNNSLVEEEVHRTGYRVERIPVSLIDRAPNAHPLDERNVDKLSKSIPKRGLIHPITVVVVGDRYQSVCGDHRVAAHELLGLHEINAEVLPEDTPEDELLMRKLHENHIRRNETLEETLQSVTALASHRDGDFQASAEMGGVSYATISKITTSIKNLSDQAKQLVSQHKVGISVTYEVSRGAKDAEEQIHWLTEYLAGRMNRDAIVAAGKANRKPTTKRKRKPKPTVLEFGFDGIGITFTIPDDASYRQVFAAMTSAKSFFNGHEKSKHPLDVLPRLMTKGGA